MRNLIGSLILILGFISCDLFPGMDVEDILCNPDQGSQLTLFQASIACDDSIANSKATGILFQKDEGNGVTYYVVKNLDAFNSPYDDYTKFQADAGYTNADTFYVTKGEGNVGNTAYVIEDFDQVGEDSTAYITRQLEDIYKGHLNNNPISEITSEGDQRRIVLECDGWATVGDTLRLITNNN